MAEDNFGRLRTGTFIKRSAEIGGRRDTQDTFSFNIEEDNNLSVTLTQMSKNANLELFRDFNGNRKIDSGDVALEFSGFNGNHDETINVSNRRSIVNKGSYIIRVTDNDPGGKFRYNMTVSAYTDPQPSQLLSGETELTLGRPRTLRRGLRTSDNAHTYRFTVPSHRTHNFLITEDDPNGAGVNMRLIKDRDGDHIVDPGDEIDPARQQMVVHLLDFLASSNLEIITFRFMATLEAVVMVIPIICLRIKHY